MEDLLRSLKFCYLLGTWESRIFCALSKYNLKIRMSDSKDRMRPSRCATTLGMEEAGGGDGRSGGHRGVQRRRHRRSAPEGRFSAPLAWLRVEKESWPQVQKGHTLKAKAGRRRVHSTLHPNTLTTQQTHTHHTDSHSTRMSALHTLPQGGAHAFTRGPQNVELLGGRDHVDLTTMPHHSP